MRKILVGLIAITMLFAFTACEPSTMKVVQETGNPLIAKATVKSSETFYEGDTLDSTDFFTVDLEYTNGGSASVVAVVADETTLAGGDNVVKVTLPQTQGDCYVVVSAVALNDELTVTVPADYKTVYTAEEYEDWNPSSETPADVTKVELYYADGKLAKTFTADAVSPLADGEYSVAWDSATKADITSVVVKAMYGEDTYEYSIPLTITKPAAEVNGIAVYYSVNGAKATTELGTLKYGDKVELSVWTIDSSDEQIEKVTDFDVLSGGTWKNSVTVNDEDTYSVEIIYVVDGKVYEASAEVGTGADYVMSIDSVEVSESEVENMIPGATFEATQFTVMGYKAKDSRTLVDVTSEVSVALATTTNTQQIPDDAKVGSTVKAYVSVTLDGVTEVFPVDVKVVAQG